MTLRQAEPRDLRPLAELWNEAFPGERPLADMMRRIETGAPYGGLECTWVEERDGRMAGAFRAYRFTEYLAGAALPMLGLAAVAVTPHARRRGLARALCAAAMEVGRERGDVLSVLYPFRPAFYHALGWGLVGELHAYTLRTATLADDDGRDAVRSAGDGDGRAIAACYDDVARSSNGPVQRSAAAWAHHFGLDPGPSAGDAAPDPAADAPVRAWVYDDGGVDGYALVRYRRGRVPERRTLVVHELVARDEAAYRGLLGWIAAQRDQWPLVRYDARPQERFAFRLAEPRPPGHTADRPLWFPTARVLRGPMLRVLDVPAALAGRSWTGDGVALTFQVEVDDAQVPGNRGPWHVALEESGARVHPAGPGGVDAGLATDAATFAQIFAGELPPSGAARLGLGRVHGPVETLDDVFRTREPFWLLDTF